MRSKNYDAELKEPSTIVREILLIVGVLAAFAAVVAFIGHGRFSPSGLYRNDYEGRVIEKSLAGRESQYGSGYSSRLLIESRGGERFEVAVGGHVYHRVRVGDWIKAQRGEIEVRSPGAETVSGGGAK